MIIFEIDVELLELTPSANLYLKVLLITRVQTYTPRHATVDVSRARISARERSREERL